VWLILSEPFDPSGVWLSEELQRRTDEEVVLLTSREISTASQADRGVDDDGVWFRVVAGGHRVESRTLRGVVNRICSSPSALAHAVHRRGRTDSPGLGAPLLRWLHRWPGPVLNRPNVDGLSGDFRPTFWWMDHAVKSGFSSPPSGTEGGDRGLVPRADEPGTAWVAVVGADVHGLDDPGRIVPMSLRARCRRLAQSTGASMLGIEAAPGALSGEWRFVAASLRPDLVRGGEPIVQSIARALGLSTRAPRDPSPNRTGPEFTGETTS
jgi:hypothetical protein